MNGCHAQRRHTLHMSWSIHGRLTPDHDTAGPATPVTKRANAGRCLSHQDPIDIRPAYPQLPGNLRCAETLLAQPPDLVRLDAGLAAFVHASGLGSVDALHLPFPPQVVLELGEDAREFRKLAPACSGKSRYWSGTDNKISIANDDGTIGKTGRRPDRP
jgi:hypothetical protein